VPQPTAPTHAPKYGIMEAKNRQTMVRDHWEWRKVVL